MHVSLSPCVGICQLDEATGYCLGCGRTGDEIAAWSTAGPGGRRAIWAALPARLRSLGVGVRRLPWTGSDVRGFVIRSLRDGTGAWNLAAPGAAASFPPAGAPCQLQSHRDAVEAIAGDAALRLGCGADVRAFAVDADAANGAPDRVVLAVLANRPPPPARPPVAGVILHADRGAIRPTRRHLPIRVIDADPQGAWWGIRPAAAPTAGTGSHDAALPAVPAATPDRGRSEAAAEPDADADVVIETGLGRIEVPIALARFGAEVPAQPDLPDGFIVAATFEPCQ